MLREGRPYKLDFDHDIVHIHSLNIYTDLIEYNIVRDTNVPLLRCFPLSAKLKAGDKIPTPLYMNYQTFSCLQIGPLLKRTFHSIHIDLRDTSGEKKTLSFSRYHSFCLDAHSSLQHLFSA